MELCRRCRNQSGPFHLLQLSGAGAGAGVFRSGWSALTTMLIFGLNSASYCTHSAATAASCMVNKKYS